MIRKLRFEQLSRIDKKMYRFAYKTAHKSRSKNGNKRNLIGAVFYCDQRYFTGFGVMHARVGGSTCAERMALERMYHAGYPRTKRKIKIMVVGCFADLKENVPPRPCGPCKQRMIELYTDLGNNMDCVVVSWDRSVIEKATYADISYWSYQGHR